MSVAIAGRLRRALVDTDNPRSASACARRRRWGEFCARFPGLHDMRVLDLGGVPEFWTVAPVRPRAVTTVNIADASSSADWIEHRVADACSVDDVLGRGDRYDLVVSNSLLEHVGGYERRCRLAEVVHRAAGMHWVQTPNRYFPLEPHWLAPGWQFLPVPARAAVLRRWSISHDRPADRAEAVHTVLSTELVSRAEMRLTFPDSEIWAERVVGLPKSLVAVRAG